MTIAPGEEVLAEDILAIQATADAALDAITTATMGVTKVDRSGAIALGGQAQQLMAANPDRRGWSFQNKSNSNLWFNDVGGNADPVASSSTYLPPGSYYESEPGGASVAAISLVGDVTGAQFVAKEW
jgi:hypothetical protein